MVFLLILVYSGNVGLEIYVFGFSVVGLYDVQDSRFVFLSVLFIMYKSTNIILFNSLLLYGSWVLFSFLDSYVRNLLLVF